MYKIEKRDFGFRLTFGDQIKANEMQQWVEESKEALQPVSGPFGVFVDMRTLKPLPSDAQEQIRAGQKLYKQKGMVRSVVIVSNPVTKMQFKRIAQETGIYEWERYIDEQSDPDWESTGLAWIREARDPDLVMDYH